jgi:predicted  nucleic acid-binding Zn-ribbon protein
MNADIQNLVKLQALDDEIRALKSRLAAIPKEVEALEKEVASERRNQEQAKEALEEAQKQQRAREGDLSTAEEKVSKYKEQLMNVKSNEEYTAMQKQIEKAKANISDIEDAILQGLDTVEELKEKKQVRDAELTKGQAKVAVMEKELDAERRKLEAELEGRQSSRGALVPAITAALLDEYSLIANARGGIGVAAAVEEVCQVCMVRLRPQLFHELRIGEKIHHCANCKRILYYQGEQQPTAG